MNTIGLQQRFECSRCNWVVQFTAAPPMPLIREHMEKAHGGMPKVTVIA